MTSYANPSAASRLQSLQAAPTRITYRFHASKRFLKPQQVSAKRMLLLCSHLFLIYSSFLIVAWIVVLFNADASFPMPSSSAVLPRPKPKQKRHNLLPPRIPVRQLAVFLSQILCNFDSFFLLLPKHAEANHRHDKGILFCILFLISFFRFI